MNFLGHFMTAAASDALMAGSFLGDFMKGRVEKHPLIFQPGLRLHRRVDRLVDTHEALRTIARIVSPDSGRYARVVADVVCDHLLARDWSQWSDDTLEEFAADCHAVLEKYLHMMPSLPARVAVRLIDEKWLVSYRSVEGLVAALERLERRTGLDLGSRRSAPRIVESYEMLAPLTADLVSYLDSGVSNFMREHRFDNGIVIRGSTASPEDSD